MTTVPTLVSGLVPLTFTLLSPLHHGAGSSGNTQILRTQEGVNPHTGESFVVPFVSGISLRSAIRRACARLTLQALEIGEDSLSKPVVELLFSGGALTTSSTPQIDLAGPRRLDELWPPAGLFGYAAPSQIWAGSLYVDNLLPVCVENTWRMPYHPHLLQHPHASLPAASLREEDFGTRMDSIGTPAERWLSNELWLGMEDKDRSQQMITDWQVIKPGTILYSAFALNAAPVRHVHALRAGWESLLNEGTIRLAAKQRTGFGLCRAEADWSALPDLDTGWVTQLAEHRDELMALFTAAAGK